MNYLKHFLLFSITAISGAGGIASASPAYPTKPIRVVVGYPAGQSSEQTARFVLNKMGEILGQSLYIENKPGASGTIGAALVASSAPDGMTLFWGSTAPVAIAPTLYKSLPYLVSDLIPIVHVNSSPSYLVTSATSEFVSVQELIARAKAVPGKLNYGSAGNGSVQHLSMELFKAAAKLDITHIPYKGSAMALNDIAGGFTDVGFETSQTALALARGGRIRLLGVTSSKRTPQAPDVPTIAEQGFANFEIASWSGIFAPKGTPKEIIDRLNRVANEVIKDPETVKYFESIGGEPAGGGSAEFSQFIAREQVRWAEAIKQSGAKID